MVRCNIPISSSITWALFFASCVRALPAQMFSRADDPFFTPPSGYESAQPGEILSHRPLQAAFFGQTRANVDSYQVLYRTTGINGEPIATATTIFLPTVSTIKDRYISYQSSYDSAAAACNPSQNYGLDSSNSNVIVSVDLLFIELYVNMGYIVASPDHEGPDAAFGAGRLAGQAVLDGIRAVNSYRYALGLSTDNPTVAGTGYGGGALATGWAAQLQASYASDLQIAGWALGGVPANLTAAFQADDGQFSASVIPTAITGLNKPSAYSSTLGPAINDGITEIGSAYLNYTESHCQSDNLVYFAQKPVLDTLPRDFLANPTVANILNENALGSDPSLTPMAPMQIYHANGDELYPFQPVSDLADNWCLNGAHLQFLIFAQGGHESTEILNLLNVAGFLSNVLDGTGVQGCSTTSTSQISLDSKALGQEQEPIVSRMVNLLNHFGHQDEHLKSNIADVKAPSVAA